MHELLPKIRIGISLGFRFPLAARRCVRCGHMELQFSRNLGASCGPCVFPVASRFATGTPALPRYAPRSVTMRGGLGILQRVESQASNRSMPWRWSEAPLRGRRVSRRVKVCFCFGRPNWLQVGSKIGFFRVLFARCFEVAFFSVFRWFFNGFGVVSEGIWECFGIVFHVFFKQMLFFKK